MTSHYWPMCSFIPLLNIIKIFTKWYHFKSYLFCWYVLGKVLAPSHLQAMTGLPFVLACNITLETGEDLKQVLWLDMTNKTILHYQPDKYDHVTQVDGVELSQQTAGQQAHTSVITIRRAAPANEGCYQCLFDVYPTGQQRGRTCLSLTGEAW